MLFSFNNFLHWFVCLRTRACFSAKCFNDGKPIRLPYDVHRSLAKWREARGLDAEAQAQGGDRESDSDSVSTQEEAPSSQWFPPNFRGGLRSVFNLSESQTSLLLEVLYSKLESFHWLLPQLDFIRH